MIDTLPYLSYLTIDKISSGLFDLLCSLSRIQGITRYEKFAPSVPLYCRHVFLVSGTLGLPRTCGTMIVMVDDYHNRYVM